MTSKLPRLDDLLVSSNRNQPFIAVDTETTGSRRHKPYPNFKHVPAPFIVTTCDHEGEQHIFKAPVDPHTRQVNWANNTKAKLNQVLNRYRVKVFHNSPFDVPMLREMGITIPWSEVEDTLAQSHVCDSNESHALKDLGIKYLNTLDTDEKVLKQTVERARRKAKNLSIPTGPKVYTDYFLPGEVLEGKDRNIVDKYALLDARRTALLHIMYQKHVIPQLGVETPYLRERSILPVVDEMQTRGIRIRPIALRNKRKQFSDAREQCVKRMRDLSNNRLFNPNSYPQLSDVLYNIFKLKPVSVSAATGEPSNDKNAIPKLIEQASKFRKKAPYKFLQSLLAYRTWDTGTKYLNEYERESVLTLGGYFIYPSFNPWATDTTRFSSSQPNAQNVSKESDIPLRSVFGPQHDWVWISIDYDQLELRVMAVLSGDPTMQKALKEGKDLHQMTADVFNVSRKMGKIINFRWQYGGGAEGLGAMIGVSGVSFTEGMRKRYPKVVEFMNRTTSQAHRQGYVETLFGYRLSTPEDRPYAGTNYADQGTAGDILKNALILVYDYIRTHNLQNNIHIIATIHDEILFAVKRPVPTRHIKQIARLMKHAGNTLNTPVHTPVDISIIHKSWASPKRWAAKNR